jgi:hypothetical protein
MRFVPALAISFVGTVGVATMAHADCWRLPNGHLATGGGTPPVAGAQKIQCPSKTSGKPSSQQTGPRVMPSGPLEQPKTTADQEPHRRARERKDGTSASTKQDCVATQTQAKPNDRIQDNPSGSTKGQNWYTQLIPSASSGTPTPAGNGRDPSAGDAAKDCKGLVGRR